AEAASGGGAVGIIIEASREVHDQATAESLRARYPKLKILVLSPGGRQPEMRGWLVFNKNGILQVSSPTSQPGLDSNEALVRYRQASQNDQPPLYTFSWDLTSPLAKEQGPEPQDYALAIAEAGALHADLILEVHDRQQKRLAGGEKEALADW